MTEYWLTTSKNELSGHPPPSGLPSERKTTKDITFSKGNYLVVEKIGQVCFAAGFLHGVDYAIQANSIEENPVKSPGKETDMNEVKTKIKAFFESRHGEEIDFVDISEAFEDIPLPDIVQACEELEREGKIAEVN